MARRPNKTEPTPETNSTATASAQPRVSKEDLQDVIDRKVEEEKDKVRLVNLSLRRAKCQIENPNGEGLIWVRCEPFQITPEMSRKRADRIRKRPPARGNMRQNYTWAIVPSTGTDITTFKDEATGRVFQTCKGLGCLEDSTAQKDPPLFHSVQQAQQLITVLETEAAIHRYTGEFDFRPMVTTYAHHVISERRKAYNIARRTGQDVEEPNVVNERRVVN